ncbi:ethionine resistance protein [Mucor velutinosus]|uniref:Ethionine resistance protein n=1 Tax=Mucor velutinosus TaxID=708070 RepID=A0AAN7I2P0_9FUNG|nr:ethionine resistance protein [Mucor velutinosus]
MKLRDRTKRVLDNVKQEDRKPAFTAAESPASITTDNNIFDLTIKQEDAKDYEDLSEQHGEFGERDYYYRCNICKRRMANLKSVLEHRKSIHVDCRWSVTMIRNIDTEPDVNDPNFHCKSCEADYGGEKPYRQHLRNVHHMVLKSKFARCAPQNGIVPDPDDPNLYCRACDYTYKQKYGYKAHCRYAHGVKPVELATQKSTSSSMDTYCQTCDKRLATMGSYRKHIFVTHKMDSKTAQRKQGNILPNANDPNSYCRSCEKKFASRKSFKKHLLAVHSICLSAPRKKSSLEPDVDDPNFYCRSCRHTYSNKYIYRNHLRRLHGMNLKSLRRSMNTGILPDWNDPTLHCTSCDRTYKSKSKYAAHCKKVHKMKESARPAKVPDSNDLPNYCRICDFSYETRHEYNVHCLIAHDIKPAELFVNLEATADTEDPNHYCSWPQPSKLSLECLRQ